MLIPPYSSSFGWYMAREGAVEPVADIMWLRHTSSLQGLRKRQPPVASLAGHCHA